MVFVSAFFANYFCSYFLFLFLFNVLVLKKERISFGLQFNVGIVHHSREDRTEGRVAGSWQVSHIVSILRNRE